MQSLHILKYANMPAPSYTHILTHTHKKPTHAVSCSRCLKMVFIISVTCCYYQQNKKAANGRAGFKLASANQPLLVISLFVA